MAKNVRTEEAAWLGPVFLAIALITGLRVALLALNATDLFVDEAQYWLWGEDLALGYYSKPPLIGWVIRAFTEIGSDSAFWIRLPGPLLHGATALILADIAARIYGARAALLAALVWLTLPMVALASQLISTDSVMLPLFALTLGAYLRALDAPTRGTAVAAGLALGLAFLGKYAAVYFLLCLALAAVVMPRARLPWRWVTLMLSVFAVTIAPNIIWNALNGFSTLQHTLDNAQWVRDPGADAQPDLTRAFVFFAEQFAVIGPVLFGGLIWVALRGNGTPHGRLLVLFALPVVAIVCGQAFLSKAYANWAAAAYVAGTLAVLPWLMRHRAALILSFAVAAPISIALPLASVFPGFTIEGRMPLERYLGRADLSRALIDKARSEGLGIIVSENRGLLADLFYTGRDAGLAFHAAPVPGRPPHHYAQKHSLPAGTQGEVLFASMGKAPPCTAAELAQIAPQTGAWRKATITLFRAPADCWAP